MNFKNVENKYRPIPFWSWNDKLNTDETRRQIGIMNDAGIGGYFMHARGGLQTEFMGEEWFDNIAAAADEGKKCGMDAWAYDENGWPSGFGNGSVNGLGDEYRQKYLRYEEGEKQTDTTICCRDGYHFYYEINPFYVDLADKKVVKKFIEEIHETYYKKCGNSIKGFFTDEPQLSRNGIPWSFVFPGEYKKRYGKDLTESLIELFKNVGDYENTRLNFWKMVSDLFVESYSKQIYEWCLAHGYEYTGHMVLEETLHSQLTSGNVMPHFRYFTMPGMDWLGRDIFDCLTPLEVGSVAHQFGKKQVLSETFALCGHNVSFEELRRILEWQMVRGITTLCPHLEGYSLKGIRKRDYPPAMYYQQPWWDEYKIFIDMMSRTGKILSEGKPVFDTLLIHPQSTAWICYNDDKNEGLSEYDEAFIETVKTLEKKHILFHLGDETIMEEHAEVVGNTLKIGTQVYSRIVLPKHIRFLESTEKLLEKYIANGGIIVSEQEIAANDITDNENITYTSRVYDDFTVHYFVNTTDKEQTAKITRGSLYIDPKTGDTHPFYGEHTFRAYDSLLVVENGEKRAEKVNEDEGKAVSTDGTWKVKTFTENSITLDCCDYYFDGELQEKNGYVLNIQGRATNLKRPVDIKIVYRADIREIPDNLCLVCETPELFDIKVNGTKIGNTSVGTFRDSAFKKLPIAKYAKCGINEIEMDIHFVQAPEVYENLEKAMIFESELNKLYYTTEIEAVYLTGDFGVYCDNSAEELERDAFRINGGFYIDKPKSEISLKNIEQQGFLFFAGKLSVEKEIEAENENMYFEFNKTGINAVNVYVNGEYTDTLIYGGSRSSLAKYLKKGKNVLRIEIVNNLRNLLGPHHLKEGESFSVSPRSFYNEPCVWNRNAAWGSYPGSPWHDGYCFVHMSID